MKNVARDLTAIAIGAAIIATLGPLSIPLTLVPITLQTLGVGLVATVFPVRIAVPSVLIYLLLGGIGLPVFARGESGFHILAQATAGFLWGFIPYAFIASRLIKAISKTWQIALVNTLGLLVVFLMGAAYFAYFTKMGLTKTLNLAVLPFIPGEIIKVTVISIVAPAIFRAIRGTYWYKAG